MSEKPNIYWIDLFCGAGGTSEGIERSGGKVIVCVNHNHFAINSHKANHPEAIHFQEDVRNKDVVKAIAKIVAEIRAKDPRAIICIWASLECTNFSIAKGGLPRDADSRTLAEHMNMYIEAINPDYFWVENVKEFMSWGPLDQNGRPVSRTAGQDFLKWCESIEKLGYKKDYRLLNSANYGAYQARERLFMQFVKPGLPITWPEQTHTKEKVVSGLFPMKQWNAVRDVLELNDHGQSILTRKKPLSDKTLKRILAGLKKFVPKGQTGFTKQYNSGKDVHRCKSLDEPIGTITTNNSHAIVQTSYLHSYYGKGNVHDLNGPCPTVSTKDRFAKANVFFLDQQYGNSKPKDIDSPTGALTANPKFNLVESQFIMNGNSSTSPAKSLDEPAPTITQRTHLIVNPGWGGHSSGVDSPCVTVIARQDKAPLRLLSVEHGSVAHAIYEEDSEVMIEIKTFMVQHGITDIKMRMLHISELLQIQGFPKNYKLLGTKAERKKQIGNAVEVNQAKAIIQSHTLALEEHFNKMAA